jgi:hypothetical protein
MRGRRRDYSRGRAEIVIDLDDPKGSFRDSVEPATSKPV